MNVPVHIIYLFFLGDELISELKEQKKLPSAPTPVELKACAIDTMAIYRCSVPTCKEFFCGGMVSCAEELKLVKEELRCHECIWSG